MSFVGKRLNLFILLMMLLILIGFGGVSVYYQYTFKNINDKYTNLNSDYDICMQNLSHTTSDLNKAFANLASTTTDIRKYDELYESKESEIKAKEDLVDELTADLTRVTLQKEVYKNQIDEAYIEINDLRANNTILENQKASLETDIFNLEEEVECLLNQDDEDEYDMCSS